MRSHYKPEDFRREKRRVAWISVIFGGLSLAFCSVAAYGLWASTRSPKPQSPIPSLSVEEQILGELVRGNVLLERIAKALETKPVATTNALRTPLPGVAEQLGVSAETKRLVAELQDGGDAK